LADEIGTRMNNMNPHEPSSSPQGDSYDLWDVRLKLLSLQ
jgi:hypothetical protein